MAKAKKAAKSGAGAKQRRQDEDGHLRAVHQKFTERHPEKAREERGFRLDQRRLSEDWGHKVNGTPETHQKASRVRQGALARLFMSGAIDAHQLADAVEIAGLHARIGADVAIGTCSYETRVDQSRSGDGTFYEKLGAVRAEIAYSRWRAALSQPGPVLAMICEDLGLSNVAARYRMRKDGARALLIAALDEWPDYQREARDEVDEADLLAAQAGLM